MKEYSVATAYELAVFMKDVNYRLADGWELQAGIAVAHRQGENPPWNWAQAMVREKASDGPIEFASSGEKQGHAQLKGF